MGCRWTEPRVPLGARLCGPETGGLRSIGSCWRIPPPSTCGYSQGATRTARGRWPARFTVTDTRAFSDETGASTALARAAARVALIFDFAARLWLSGQSRDSRLRGREFIEVRQRLLAIFGEDAGVGG